jgi:hypothetical protein
VIHHPHHVIAARFDTPSDADEAAHDLEPLAHQLHVTVHHRGTFRGDEAERLMLRSMALTMAVAIPLAAAALAAFTWLAVDDLPAGTLAAVAAGPGTILGLLLGGLAGIMASERRLHDAYHRPADAHDDDEVVVAEVERRALLDPCHRYEAWGATRDDAVRQIEREVQRVFAAHHGHPVAA